MSVRWQKIQNTPIGQGGNCSIFLCQNSDGERGALKTPRKKTDTRLARLRAEVHALTALSDVDGVIPLLDCENPSEPDKSSWYVMPVAKPFWEFIAKLDTKKIVEHFSGLCTTLKEIHQREFSHRDIQPGNFLALNERLHFSDFGLVTYPDKVEQTRSDSALGALSTMAPEMRRDPTSADPYAADIYSFAKTLWMALTGERRGFDGQYTNFSNIALSRFLPDVFTQKLDDILAACTDNDPQNRVGPDKLREALDAWLRQQENFHALNLEQWAYKEKLLFPCSTPTTTVWERPDAISKVLREFCEPVHLNHFFFPDGGGKSIIDVLPSAEDPMLINILSQGGSITSLKPARLSYESFGDGMKWNYFFLEASPMPSLGTPEIYAHYKGYHEEYRLLSNGRKVSEDEYWSMYKAGIIGDDDEVVVSRYTNGSFVLVSTRSPYNLDASTYDGRHARMTRDEFRQYIMHSISKLNRSYTCT